jgi:hypothetical protein
MRYFAHVRPTLEIDQVVCVADSDVGNLPYPESEPVGQEFLHALYGTNDQWLETSMTGAFRGRPATVGVYYMPDIDEFGPIPEPEPDPEEEPEEEEYP